MKRNCNHLENYIIKKKDITDIMAGDTIIDKEGKMRTVTGKDIKHKTFMGSTLFGDSYRLGTEKVDVVYFYALTH